MEFLEDNYESFNIGWGRGKRLGNVSEHLNKSMLKLAGKPVLEYNLERAVELDIDEVILLVGR